MYIIGITGASGSGKTTLAQRLMEHFGDMAELISLDSYYKDFSDLPFEKRAALNFDAPDIHDHLLLEQDLRALLRGEDIPRRDYDFVNHRRAAERGVIRPHPIIIIEGIHVFARQEVRDLCDLRVFAELDPDVAILRRVKRDMEERGRDLDGITLQYLRTVKPMYERYIRNYKDCADIVVPTLIHSGVGAEMIYGYVMNHLNDKENK
ncbi:MAG: uridine kinase [Butyricicoccaceae bacterium]